jgi:hypothetical protein
MAEMELPWPEDVFGKVPEGDWHAIDVFAKTLGYRVDTISGDLMRRGWKVYERLLRERVNDLVEQGFVITTDPSNPPKQVLEILEGVE